MQNTLTVPRIRFRRQAIRCIIPSANFHSTTKQGVCIASLNLIFPAFGGLCSVHSREDYELCKLKLCFVHSQRRIFAFEFGNCFNFGEMHLIKKYLPWNFQAEKKSLEHWVNTSAGNKKRNPGFCLMRTMRMKSVADKIRNGSTFLEQPLQIVSYDLQ